MKALPSQEYLNECFTYNPESGELFWKARPRHHFVQVDGFTRSLQKAGREAGWSNSFGYKKVKIGTKAFMVARIIWKMVYGTDPEQVDHINGDRCDNRLGNLRNVNNQENSKNRAKSRNNTTGYMGVGWIKGMDKWSSVITDNGKVLWLGRHDTLFEAVAARVSAENALGYHTNHNR
jgi:hypothetical protein